MIAELVALIEGRAASLLISQRYSDAYEATRCALAIRRAA